MKKFLLLIVITALVSPVTAQRTRAPEAMKHHSRHMQIENPDKLHGKPLRPDLQMSSPALKAAGHLTVLDSQVYFVFNPVTESFDPDWKAFYTFNEDGLLTEYSEEEWMEESGSFKQTDYETNEYDEQGNLLVYIDYDLDETGTSFFGEYKVEYTYDNGRLIQTLESGKDAPGESWYTIWRTDYQYNGNNQVAGTREYVNLTGWSETWRTEYVYDEEGRLVTYFDYDDNADLPSGWEYAWREEYTYDFEGQLDVYEESEWEPDFNQWFPTDREEYNILANGDVLSYTDFDWDEAGEEWVPNWMGEYSYNPDIPYEELALPWFFHDDFPNYFNHLMTGYVNYTYTEGGWVLDSRGTYYFTLSGSTGLSPKNTAEDLILYPNPASNTIYLPASSDIARVEAFDLTGKKVYSEKIPQQNAIQIDHLSDGVYFFRLLNRNEEIISSQKIILKR